MFSSLLSSGELPRGIPPRLRRTDPQPGCEISTEQFVWDIKLGGTAWTGEKRGHLALGCSFGVALVVVSAVTSLKHRSELSPPRRIVPFPGERRTPLFLFLQKTERFQIGCGALDVQLSSVRCSSLGMEWSPVLNALQLCGYAMLRCTTCHSARA